MSNELRQVSPTKLNILNACPRCFWLQEVKKIKRPSTPFPTILMKMDKLTKEVFDTGRTMEGWVADKLGIQGNLFPDLEVLGKWRNWRRGLQAEFPDIGIKLIGALDDVLVAGKYSPLDYKTRGYAPKTDGSEYYQSQLDLYSLLLESNGYKTSGYGYLVYVYPVSMERLDLTVFTTQTFKIECSIDNAKKLLVKASEILNMDTSPEPSPECSYCGYVDKLNS